MDWHENLATIWETVADTVGEAAAILQGARTETWRQFDDRASRLASALSVMGVGAGDTVAIDLYNCIEYLETVFAAFKLRAAPVNVNYRYRESELAYILEDSLAKVIVFHGSLAERVVAVVGKCAHPVGLVNVDDGTAAPAEASDFESLLADHDPYPRLTRSGDDDFILYTGGTTGMPRGVVWGHSSLFAMQHMQFKTRGLSVPGSIEELAQAVRQVHEGHDVPMTLVVSPLMHGTAIFTSMGTFAVGGKVILCTSRSLDAEEICRLVGEHRIKQLAIVGDAFAKPILSCLDRARAEGHPYDLSSLERITSVGVTWSSQVKDGLLRHGDFVLTDSIAATEGGGFASSVTRAGETSETSHFRLGPNAIVIDDEGKPIEAGSGKAGLLAATGPMPKRYLNDPEKTARTWRVIGGIRYVVPGDMATVGADGTVVLHGRGSEVVNTGGEKVFVEEVEQAIAELEGVRDVVVVGVPDERFGQRIGAIVSLEPGRFLAERDVIDHVGARLADHKRPRQVLFVEEVGRTPAGKADRTRAREALLAASA